MALGTLPVVDAPLSVVVSLVPARLVELAVVAVALEPPLVMVAPLSVVPLVPERLVELAVVVVALKPLPLVVASLRVVVPLGPERLAELAVVMVALGPLHVVVAPLSVVVPLVPDRLVQLAVVMLALEPLPVVAVPLGVVVPLVIDSVVLVLLEDVVIFALCVKLPVLCVLMRDVGVGQVAGELGGVAVDALFPWGLRRWAGAGRRAGGVRGRAGEGGPAAPNS